MIQWFPGHMTKALRQMEEEASRVDVLLYVLDSRAPQACLNPKFCALQGNKPIIYVFNKFDLCDKNKTREFSKTLGGKSACIFINSTESGSSKNISKIAATLCEEKINKRRAKGLNTILRCMVIGVPNSGKSTLVNNLAKECKAITGNKPGVTKGKQWVKISDNFEVLDTPGTLWPSFETDEIGYALAFIGSIKDDIIDIADLALKFIEYLIATNNGKLLERYNITDPMSPLEILEQIAINKKLILKKNEIDYDRAARLIIDDFRKGKLGGFTII